MTKELLTIEFRTSSTTQTITVGVFDTLVEAVAAGNDALVILSKRFEVRTDDKFVLSNRFGVPTKLVSNTFYPTNGVEFFAKITTLSFVEDLDQFLTNYH